MAEKAPNKSSEDSAFWSNESGGNLDVQPSLAVRNVDLISFSEIPRGSIVETRKKAPSEILTKKKSEKPCNKASEN